MKKLELKGTQRSGVGKKDAKKLRREGRIPAVLYGGSENIHLSLERKEFNKAVFTPNVHRIQLDLDGTTHDTIIQSLQFDPVSDNVVHADLLELHPEKPVKVKIPVRTHGIAEGVRTGGRLRVALKQITVVAKPDKIPEAIEVNIENMQVGDYIRIGDLDYPELEFMRDPETMIVAVRALRSLEEALPAEGEEEGEEGEEGEGAEEGEGSEEGASEESAEGDSEEENG